MTEAFYQFVSDNSKACTEPDIRKDGEHLLPFLRAFVKEVIREEFECNGDVRRAFDIVVQEFGLNEDKP